MFYLNGTSYISFYLSIFIRYIFWILFIYSNCGCQLAQNSNESSKFKNHSLGTKYVVLNLNDTLTITPNLGETDYVLKIPSPDSTYTLDIVNVDRVSVSLLNNDYSVITEIEPTIVEFRHNRIGQEKHYIFNTSYLLSNMFSVKISFFKQPKKTINRILYIKNDKLKAYTEHQFYLDRYNNGFIIFMLGTFILQIIYNTILALSRNRIEYWFLLFFCIEYFRLHLIFFQYQLNWNLPNWVVFPNDIFISTTIFMVLYYMFFSFFYPNLKKFTVIGITYLLINLCIYAYFTYSNQFILRENFWGISLASSYSLSLILLYFLFRIKDPTKIFFIVGTLSLLTSAIISRVIFAYDIQTEYDHYALRMVTYLFDFMMLNAALNYRHNLEKKIEQKRLENERNRIANEMHDDLGAGLSTIQLLGERAQMGMDDTENKGQIQKMTHQATELIDTMSTIIWAINSRNDTVKSLINYVRSYAADYLEETNGLVLHFPLPQLPPSVSAVILTGDTRREVFLSFKEALHNVVKHAESTAVDININFKNNALVIHIQDNGKGFDNKNALGNGLKNMTERLEKIGGQFTIQAAEPTGTLVILSLPPYKS